MKTKSLFLICILHFLFSYSFTQVPADSLLGTYIGQYWYANPFNSPWIITPDTLYVSYIDTLNCEIVANCNHFGVAGPSGIYHTDYYSCNSPSPINNYTKFYAGDSIRMIADTLPQPYPNSPISDRFYGKRISNQTVGINNVSFDNIIDIYPNPCYEKLNIDCKTANENVVLIIMDIFGKEIINETMFSDKKIQINVSKFKVGIYFIKLETKGKVITKKIIVQP